MLCEVLKAGRLDYDSAMILQNDVVEARLRGDVPDRLILVEHDPVVTIGRRGTEGEVSLDLLPAHDIQLRETSRGGAVTFHEPGQIVGYPIMDLARHGKDVHDYLRRLERCIIDSLRDFDIDSSRRQGHTGVWVDGRKIASIGIAVRRWVTYHGFAVNVQNDLSGFDSIVPCGIPGCQMTSVSIEAHRKVTIDEYVGALLPAFVAEFGYELVEARQAGRRNV